MPQRLPDVNPLDLRKALLIAESELNRARLIGECQAMTGWQRTFGARVRSAGLLASAVGRIVSGIFASRRKPDSANKAKTSWLETTLKDAQCMIFAWAEFRRRFGSDRSD